MHINRSISRVLAAAVASAGLAVPMPSTSATLSCTSASFTATSDGNGNINVSCTQSGTTGGTCTISVSPGTLPAAGGGVTVSTSCGANTSLSGGKSVSQSGSNSWTDAIPANGLATGVTYTYTVTGDGGSKSATVFQSGTGTTSPPPSGAISCPGYASTVVIDLPWGAPGTAAPRVVSKGFGHNGILVARFTTPAATAAGVTASIKASEWGDEPHQRTGALSTSPCAIPDINPLGRLATRTGLTPTVTYMVGGSSTWYAVLQPSTTYYFNIKNEVNGVSYCAPGQSCNMAVELQKPLGL